MTKGIITKDGVHRTTKDGRMVHKLIARTAKEFAAAFYENAAHDNTFYRYYPSVKFFVDYEWPRFVMLVKQKFAQMLAGNAISESEKAEIYEALLADSTLPYSAKENQITSMIH